MKIKNILMGLLILFVLCSISSVGAIELNDTQSPDNDFVTFSNDNIQSYNSNEDNLSLASGSFSQLKDQIDKASDGSVIKLIKKHFSIQINKWYDYFRKLNNKK